MPGSPSDCKLEIFDSETGDRWWIQGHHAENVAVAALKTWVVEVVGDPDYFDLSDLSVSHVYYRDAHDPKTDERWEECEATDEGAEPFTVIDA